MTVLGLAAGIGQADYRGNVLGHVPRAFPTPRAGSRATAGRRCPFELWQSQVADDDGVLDGVTFTSHPWSARQYPIRL
ncbi:MAG: hypothetical protein KatS3mg111_0600 [Pirellulaceae bacterium]|nr:MAG: hypothetical protein KatS3mg111_0600 [Pirellulaceae bacterium]